LQTYALLEGKKVTGLEDPRLNIYLKYLVLYADFYYPIVIFTNISILFFYRRIFGVNKTFQHTSLALIVFEIIWFIPGFFVELFMCKPVSTLWTNFIAEPEKCIWYSTFWVIIMATELLSDFMILVLPISRVIQLKLPWQKKCFLSLIFLLGGFAIVTGIVRIAVSYSPGNQNVDLVQDIFWLNIHLGVVIICACLPICGPLISEGVSIISSNITTFYGSGSGLSSSNLQNSEQFRGDEVHLVGMDRKGDIV